MGLIYCITNLINGKKYVGQTHVGLEQRFRRHCWYCTQKSGKMPISLAIKKYGKINFKIEKLCECNTQVDLDNMEIYYAKNLNTYSPNGYNLRAGAGIGTMSEETKKKISKALMGHSVSKETLRKMSLRKTSETTKFIIAQANKGNENAAKKRFVKTPSGEFVEIFNMAKFLRNHTYLSKPGIYRMLRGELENYKGWTRA